MIALGRRSNVVFMGDSITDSGRDRALPASPGGLGNGYVSLIAKRTHELAALGIHFHNRGIAGNTVSDLKKRWTEDCLNLNPGVLSILVGINDAVQIKDGNPVVSDDLFEADYRYLLETATREHPNIQIVLMEPFFLPVRDEQYAQCQDSFFRKLCIVRSLAREFADAFLPLDGLFAKASCRSNMTNLLPDGIHPTPAGAALIADAWLDCLSV